MNRQNTRYEIQNTGLKLNAKSLRSSRPTEADLKKIKRRQIYIILDNILDTYNIGSIFRLADAVAAFKVYLCGQTATPPYHRIAKAAVGTEKWVPWEKVDSVSEAVSKLENEFSLRSNSTVRRHSRPDRESDIATDGTMSKKDPRIREDDTLRIVAIEQSKKSIDYRKADLTEPVAFIVGHETTGVSKEALKLADEIVELPMYGVNASLNVMVSLAIVLFKAIE